MGYKEFDLKVPVSTSDEELTDILRRKTRIHQFSIKILKKSLDARNKRNIVWQYRVGLNSAEIKEGTPPQVPTLEPIFEKRKEHVLITGSGPAGLFSALFLAQSGYRVTLLEKGSNVETRKAVIEKFESGGIFNSTNNYAFGEGGAGTFSDGKLTSRTKSIKAERNYIFEQLINNGAPEEIFYMTHPHLGTDKLFRITQNIRQQLVNLGCTLLFDTTLTGLKIKNGQVKSAETSQGIIDADRFILAIGHSSFDTYKMLIRSGVEFNSKNFALGFRVEHEQELINKAQWGTSSLQGVKAAEYRLTAETDDKTQVYSFCMCPGGKVVPAATSPHTNIVNGMSYYQRDSKWANAAVVAGLNLEKMLKKPISALEAINWLEQLETLYYEKTGSYKAPASTISAFLSGKPSSKLPESSYPFDLYEANFDELLPGKILPPLRQGLKNFCNKLRNYQEGIIIGLESKTSSPIQVQRTPGKHSSGFPNLYIAGEGSGWAGGIISSAADGLKISQQILIPL